jgi:protein-disulfide isomerase
MVICIIALPVFAILGIFSLKYRTLTKEAFRCLFRTIALKPCDTGLDQRIKSNFTAKLLWWPALSRFFYKRFVILSWVFVILLLASTGFTGYGIYNYIKYGNCNGEQSVAFCIFNAAKPEFLLPAQQQTESCSAIGTKQSLYPDKITLHDGEPVRGKPDAKLTIIEYGCFSCAYTKEAEPVVRKILQNYPQVNLVYLDVPLDVHKNSVEAALAAECAKEQDKYWEYHDALFENHDALSDTMFVEIAKQLKINTTQFKDCYTTKRYQEEVDADYQNAMEVGIYGTPTFFVNDKNLVGPQDYKTFANMVEGELK